MLIPVKNFGEFTATVQCVMKDSATVLFDNSFPVSRSDMSCIFPDYIMSRVIPPINKICDGQSVQLKFALRL